ncbi:hypothetical protein BPODLACK_03789 [Gordonia sp. YY1]|nr:hypothetical protein BPODLACK_03789 [Gordonia sp. YY1]
MSGPDYEHLNDQADLGLTDLLEDEIGGDLE